MKYENPILSGYFPDPSICCVGNDFYIVNSSFEYFPAVPISHSKNLVNWQQIGFCVTDETMLNLEGCPNSRGVYAPTIRYHKGTFYMTTTDVSGLRNFYVTATNPSGPWSAPIKTDFPGIDPSIFFDEDDKMYYMTTSDMVDGIQTTLIAEIDPATGKCLCEKKELWGGSGGRFPEGPHLYKKDGWYYVLLAEGGTAMGHMVTMARSRNIFGPYQAAPNNPIYTHRDTIATDIHATGHMDLMEDNNGNWWAVFLGIRMRENYFHHLGRETFLAPVNWDKEDFPKINGGKLTTLSMQTDLLPAPCTPVCRDFIDDFKNSELNYRYQFVRNPSKVSYKLSNGLYLTGNHATVDTHGTPNMLVFRQQSFDCECFAHFSTNFIDDMQVGLTAFYDNTRHFDIYYDATSVTVYKRFDDFTTIAAQEAYDNSEIVLYIKTDGLQYYFGFGATEKEACQNIIAQGFARHLSTEISNMSFTGVMFGVFVQNGTKSSAHVKKIHYMETH